MKDAKEKLERYMNFGSALSLLNQQGIKMQKQVMTKRTSRNKYNWQKRVNYAVRMLNRAKYFKLRNKWG